VVDGRARSARNANELGDLHAPTVSHNCAAQNPYGSAVIRYWLIRIRSSRYMGSMRNALFALLLVACDQVPDTQVPDAHDPDAGPAIASRCSELDGTVSCPRETSLFALRDVHWQMPLGDPPPSGWPVALMFQGSLFSGELSWWAADWMPFGAYHQTLVIKRLLDAGYAVITPEAQLNGGTFWDSNTPWYANAWESSPDHRLMLALLAAIDSGAFGPLDAQRMYATGISSGGYMTSRVGIAYPGRFRALAIQSASYMTCLGPICDIPALDSAHPPTLLLHGRADLTVPIATAEAYDAALVTAGVARAMIVDAAAGHEWIAAAPDAVREWFDAH